MMDKVSQIRGHGLVAGENRTIKSLNDDTRPVYRLQLCTISASFTDTQQPNVNRKIILALFFMHLMNENKYYRITNKKNNQINIHHPDSHCKQSPW